MNCLSCYVRKIEQRAAHEHTVITQRNTNHYLHGIAIYLQIHLELLKRLRVFELLSKLVLATEIFIHFENTEVQSEYK